MSTIIIAVFTLLCIIFTAATFDSISLHPCFCCSRTT
ncbi:hypothetical protein OH492_06660 [Vibrio chagasii]|nr:hypothetical protein [Vibrio chagasii]